ncbi:cytochrome c [Nitrospirales bacterium NOB]|nr:cytochrome c [Nitrospirales bacterium NOB]
MIGMWLLARSSSQKERVLTAFVAGVVLLVAVMAIWDLKPHAGTSIKNGETIDPNMIPLVTGDEPLPELFVRAGCTVCHRIPGIVGANGQVGPPLKLAQTGPLRLADPHYRGQAKTVRDYIVESIVAPGIYVVPGFPSDTMPVWYGRKLSAAALDKIASYLEQISDETPSGDEGSR